MAATQLPTWLLSNFENKNNTGRCSFLHEVPGMCNLYYRNVNGSGSRKTKFSLQHHLITVAIWEDQAPSLVGMKASSPSIAYLLQQQPLQKQVTGQIITRLNLLSSCIMPPEGFTYILFFFLLRGAYASQYIRNQNAFFYWFMQQGYNASMLHRKWKQSFVVLKTFSSDARQSTKC